MGNKYYPMCVIVDLEGTITDCSKRIEYYNEGDYDTWNNKFLDDEVNKVFAKEFEKLSDNIDKVKIIISTAKSDDYKEDVETWLENNYFTPYNNFLPFIEDIYFRTKNDDRPSVEIKEEIFNAIEKKYVVVKAYDDRPDICDMYRRHGISTQLVSCINKKETAATAEDILTHAQNIYISRNKEYGSSYKYFGKILSGYFPDGVELKTESDFARFGILSIFLSKTDRYCKNFLTGGHRDSMFDIINYAAMLIELDSTFEFDSKVEKEEDDNNI